MSRFYIFRHVCRAVGIIAGIAALIGFVLQLSICIYLGIGILILDIILIALKNRCPFCKKSLRIAPIMSEEFCPHCGCKIE